ncbi:hypothetical protein DL93DRAFT_2092013 [Clavulina sp. PMI_390]|nr:hypothetical protein DL93DRAFT_2092013 [Clavulina sp. PMI_390]
MAPQNDAPPSRLLVLSTVSFYMFAAIAMVLANKWVLMKTSIPFFFLFAQLLIAVILLAISKWAGLFQITLQLNRETSRALVPMVAINVLGLNFNNFTLKFVDASMYQVARGLLLPITVLISGVILHTKPSSRVLMSCGIVTVGFFIGVFIDDMMNPSASAEKSVSLVGIFFGVLSSCTTALHAVVIKRSLEAVKGNTLQLAWYSNVLSSAVMIPIIILSGEVPSVLSLLAGDAPAQSGSGMTVLATFIWGTGLTGFVGFLICIAGFLSIKITSPITHMVSSAVRGVLQTFLSVAFFADIITVGRGSSIAIILAGSIYYTWVKNEESQAQKKYTPLPTSGPRDSSDQRPSVPSADMSGKENGVGFHGRASSYSHGNGSGHLELNDMRKVDYNSDGDGGRTPGYNVERED